jgi:hypothetical protein
MNIEFVADSNNKPNTKLTINGQKIKLKGITDIQISFSCNEEKPCLSVVAYGGKKKIEVVDYEL